MGQPFELPHSPTTSEPADGPRLVVVGVDGTPSAWRAFVRCRRLPVIVIP